ncbi:hypothetical protein TNCV_1871801 [Trichonephila clavipes]|nr:hypothetical protein TNCV_1871801 [Trichonephila clavipes]
MSMKLAQELNTGFCIKLTRTSAHAPQCQRSCKLKWALMGCCITEFSTNIQRLLEAMGLYVKKGFTWDLFKWTAWNTMSTSTDGNP